MRSFYSFTYRELVNFFAEHGLGSDLPSRLFLWHYKKENRDLCEHHNISPRIQKFLTENFSWSWPEIQSFIESQDGTVKFLIQLRPEDPSPIECVLIAFAGKYSLCVSSQVGCGMACRFCFTGRGGLGRSLETEEILGQYLVVRDWLRTNRQKDSWISNIVFMGQGEPLHNFEVVARAAEIFISQHGLSLGPSKVTLSTSGYLPGLRAWRQRGLQVNPALSLHAVDPDLRSELIPLNKKYPLSEIVEEFHKWRFQPKRFLTIEYLLLKGVNESVNQARDLVRFLKQDMFSLPVFLNLIPFNPFPGSGFERPSSQTVVDFFNEVGGQGFPVTLRKTKGDEILAACGQLLSRPVRENGP